MFYLFRAHGWKPSDYWGMSPGERDLVHAMAALEAEQKRPQQ